MIRVMKKELDIAYCKKMTTILEDKAARNLRDHIITDEEAEATRMYRGALEAITHLEGNAQEFIDVVVHAIIKLEI